MFQANHASTNLFFGLCDSGVLINIGPLLYHYSDVGNEISIELTYDEIKASLPHFGLRLMVRHEMSAEKRGCHFVFLVCAHNIAIQFNFVFFSFLFASPQHEEPHRPCTYARNDKSMQHIAYDCAYFVAERIERRPSPPTEAGASASP
jgi:hypothetical protein